MGFNNRHCEQHGNYNMYQILRCELFSDVTFLWEVLAPDIAKAAQPGQFVMLRLYEGGERIPLTIADFDRSKIAS